MFQEFLPDCEKLFKVLNRSCKILACLMGARRPIHICIHLMTLKSQNRSLYDKLVSTRQLWPPTDGGPLLQQPSSHWIYLSEGY